MILYRVSHLAKHPRCLNSASFQGGNRGFGVANASAIPAWLLGVLQGGACMHVCPKCAGLLVSAPSPLHLMADYFVDTWDLQDVQGEAVKCLQCGYYADAIMLMNKAKQADAHRLVTQAESWALDHSVNMNMTGGLPDASTDAGRTIDNTHSFSVTQCTVTHGSQTELFAEPCDAQLLRE